MRFSEKKKNINGEERERKQGNDDIRHCKYNEECCETFMLGSLTYK